MNDKLFWASVRRDHLRSGALHREVLVMAKHEHKPTFRDRRIAEIATENGCKPKWYDGMFGWRYHCTCKDMMHACDSQCSMITLGSARERRAS